MMMMMMMITSPRGQRKKLFSAKLSTDMMYEVRLKQGDLCTRKEEEEKVSRTKEKREEGKR